MAKKCALCKGEIETTFLGKIRGMQIGKVFVCSSCQKKFKGDVIKQLSN